MMCPLSIPNSLFGLREEELHVILVILLEADAPSATVLLPRGKLYFDALVGREEEIADIGIVIFKLKYALLLESITLQFGCSISQ